MALMDKFFSHSIFLKSMVNSKIARTRFLWRETPWMKSENVRAIWVHSVDGKISFEFEFNVPVQPNPQQPPATRIQIKDPKIIAILEDKILGFEVSGAYGKGLIVGNVNLTFSDAPKDVLVLADLKEWRDWLENKRLFRPSSL
jgi:hypothetical protein